MFPLFISNPRLFSLNSCAEGDVTEHHQGQRYLENRGVGTENLYNDERNALQFGQKQIEKNNQLIQVFILELLILCLIFSF